MGIITRKDIRCDGDDCSNWIEGGGFKKADEIRLFIRQNHGWTSRRVGTRVRDLCPDCISKLETVPTSEEDRLLIEQVRRRVRSSTRGKLPSGRSRQMTLTILGDEIGYHPQYLSAVMAGSKPLVRRLREKLEEWLTWD